MAFHNVPPNGFPDLPDVEELEAVVKDVTTLKTTTAEQGAAITNLGSTKANQITIAPFFNPETAYEAGDLVYYNGLSYRCTNDHEGAWDAADFAATTIAGEIASVKSGLNSTAVLVGISLSGTTDGNGDIGVTGATSTDYPIAFIAGQNSNDYVTFFDGSTATGYQKYLHFATRTNMEVSGTVVCVRGVVA